MGSSQERDTKQRLFGCISVSLLGHVGIIIGALVFGAQLQESFGSANGNGGQSLRMDLQDPGAGDPALGNSTASGVSQSVTEVPREVLLADSTDTDAVALPIVTASEAEVAKVEVPKVEAPKPEPVKPEPPQPVIAKAEPKIPPPPKPMKMKVAAKPAVKPAPAKALQPTYEGELETSKVEPTDSSDDTSAESFMAAAAEAEKEAAMEEATATPQAEEPPKEEPVRARKVVAAPPIDDESEDEKPATRLQPVAAPVAAAVAAPVAKLASNSKMESGDQDEFGNGTQGSASKEATPNGNGSGRAGPATNEAPGGFGTPNGIQVRDSNLLMQRSGNRPPPYPQQDRLQNRQGSVILIAYILKDGSVGQVSVQKSSGSPTIDESALKTYKTWKYYPGQEGWVRHPFVFQLAGEARELPAQLRR